MIAVTWLVPSGVFFTSIIGWQYFVGRRTVPAERCYVQYMENALFNCLLQVLALKHIFSALLSVQVYVSFLEIIIRRIIFSDNPWDIAEIAVATAYSIHDEFSVRTRSEN